METLETRPIIHMKGILIGTEVVGNYLHLWYSSPDGGQTDSQIFQMRCSNEEQAKVIESQHRKVWGL
jgi:hypothetical protein